MGTAMSKIKPLSNKNAIEYKDYRALVSEIVEDHLVRDPHEHKTCPVCKGAGNIRTRFLGVWPSQFEHCSHCNGRGWLRV